MATISRERLPSIQVLRAAAAMGVVFAHLTASFQTVFKAKDAIYDFYFGNFGVDLFFVISGFVMVYASESLFGQPGGSKQFLLKRIIRIVPLYWIMTTWVLWELEATGSSFPAPLWKIICGSYLFLPFPLATGGPLLIVGWTLNYEMFFYLIFAISVFFNRVRAVLFTTGMLIICVLIGQSFGDHLSAFWASFTNPLILEFVMGMWIALAFRYGVRIPSALSIFLILMGFGIIYCLSSTGAQDIARAMRWGTGFAFIMLAVTLSNTQARSTFWKPLVLIGEASYAIYLTHWFVLMSPPQQLVSMFQPIMHPYLYSVVIVSAVIIVGILTHFVVEKPIIGALWFIARYPFRGRLKKGSKPIEHLTVPAQPDSRESTP